MRCVLPVKKRRKRKLSKKERRQNRRLARKRFVVEHAISKIMLNIMGTRFRNRLKRYNHASDIVSGLVNFRIMRSKGMML